MKSMSMSRSSAYEGKNDLEQLFIECVDEVRKNVIKRRSDFNQRYRSSRFGAEVLNSSDKQKVLEMLICNEQVLVVLYELLFPHKASAISEIAANWTSPMGRKSTESPTSEDTTGRSTKLELEKFLDELTPCESPEPLALPSKHRKSLSMHDSEESTASHRREQQRRKYRKDVIIHNGKLLLSN